ncbi:MAG: glucoamylase family protein [Ginsengibacter sp.]
MTNPLSNIDRPVVNPQGTDWEMLENLQRETFGYFLKQVNPQNGLIADKTKHGSPVSIATVGMGLSCYIGGVERGFISRANAIKRTLTVLRFLYSSNQSSETDATGYKGFYYHFLDMQTGKRTWKCELSTIDTAILMAGILTAGNYFLGENAKEREIRQLADDLYFRVDWQWALNGQATLCHGWKPENGFLNFKWDNGYSEAIILYVLALASPTFPIDVKGYKQWTSTFKLKKIYGIEYLYAGPLFIHQMSHVWIDFRGIYDDFNKKTRVDYFENSRRATCIQQQYAINNPRKFVHYGENCWGFTASDGPGPCVLKIKGVKRRFYDYKARGVPYGPDDGTISPWAVVASLPFCPEIVLKTIRHAIEKLDLKKHTDGFDASFNPAYIRKGTNPNGWISPWKFGLNQGPIILMIENYHSGLIWKIMRECPYIVKGLRHAGFTGGWLQ